MIVLLPAFGTVGHPALGPPARARFARRLRPGHGDGRSSCRCCCWGPGLPLRLAPCVEALLFGGDFRLWLDSALGLVYDQRNCLVVGLAMGFAVIPIIFTIAEDAFSSVPHAPDRRLAGPGRQPLADGAARGAAHGQPRHLLGGDDRLRPRGRRDHDRAHGHRATRPSSTGRSSTACARSRPTSRSRSPRRPTAGTLYRVLFLAGVRPLPHDLRRQHGRRADPPAPPRAVPGRL